MGEGGAWGDLGSFESSSLGKGTAWVRGVSPAVGRHASARFCPRGCARQDLGSRGAGGGGRPLCVVPQLALGPGAGQGKAALGHLFPDCLLPPHPPPPGSSRQLYHLPLSSSLSGPSVICGSVSVSLSLFSSVSSSVTSRLVSVAIFFLPLPLPPSQVWLGLCPGCPGF